MAAFPQGLPDGKGKDLVEQICSDCHEIAVITGQRATREGWQATVKKMVNHGAAASPEEAQTIVEYLAKNFPKAETVNVNRATAKEIEAVLQVSAADAQSVVRYREEHGAFQDWAALGKAIDLKKLEGKKDLVRFE